MDSTNNITAPQIPAEEVKPTGKYGVVSTGAFFGLGLLYSIPLIGWIVCIIMCFAPKNVNTKHFARATLIRLIMGLAITAAIVALVFSLVNMAMAQLPGMMDQLLPGIMEQVPGLDAIGEENLEQISNVMSEIQSGKYQELINELQSGKLGDVEELGNVLEQVQNGDYLGIIEDYQNGKYDEMIGKFENGGYDELIEKATNGDLGDLGELGDLLDQYMNGNAVELPLP